MPKNPILFGIGVGLIFSCLAFFYIYSNTLPKTDEQTDDPPLQSEITDDDIIMRAEELGMVFYTPMPYHPPEPTYQTPQPTEPSNLLPVTDVLPDAAPNISLIEGLVDEGLVDEGLVDTDLVEPNETKPETELEAEPEEEIIWEDIIEPAPEIKPEPTKAPVSSEAAARKKANIVIPEPYIPEGEAVAVNIPEKATATDISRILYNAGIIEDSVNFLQLLIDLEYTHIMACGTFYIVPGTDYYTIANMMSIKLRGNR